MRTNVHVALNGVALHSLHPDIVLQSANDKAAVIKNSAVTMGSRIGQQLTGTERQYIEVQVVFAIANKTLSTRQSILQTVASWASKGGKLTLSYRSGQELDVVLESLFDTGYIYEWTNNYTITFRAYAVPYWQATAYTTFSLSGATQISVPGNAPTPLEIVFTPSSAVSSIPIRHYTTGTAYEHMTFNHAMTAGTTFEMTMHGAYVSAMAGTTDVLGKLDTGSVGIILLQGGTTEKVEVTAGNATARVKARWL